MNVPVVTAVMKLFGKVTGLASEYIEDKDKRNAFLFELQKLQGESDQIIVQQVTVPWVDAFVKIMYALVSIVNKTWRPVGGACMTGFVMYCALYNVALDPNIQLLFSSAFPSWGLSRHLKQMKSKD